MASERAIGDLLDLIVGAHPSNEGPEALERKDIKQLRKGLKQPNVVGIGVAFKVTSSKTSATVGLTYYVSRKVSLAKLAASDAIPPAIVSPSGAGILTDVVEIGVLKPQVNVRRSPVGPGYSVGHFTGDTGTLGAIVVRDGRRFLLSNSHVLAICGKAKKGDVITFPGGDDGGRRTKDAVAKLFEFTKIKARGLNTVDVAIAEIADEHLKVIAKITGIGLVTKTTKAKIGMDVEKVGRTSGRTKGKVLSTKFRPLRMPYPGIGDVSFEDQILISRFTEPGDSGALIVDAKSKKAIGLHFAGARGGSVAAPIQRTFELMKVSLAKGDS